MKKDLTKKNSGHSGKRVKIAIVYSEFNDHIVKKLLKETLKELKNNNATNIKTHSVPGALEIPIAVKKIAEKKHFDVIIALGVVIKGATYHFEHVSRESINGIMQVSLETMTPVISGILTVNSEKQANERVDRGKEFAISALHIADTLKKI